MSIETEAPPEQHVSQPETSVLYMARRSELRLTIKSRYPVRDPITGQHAGTTPGIFVGFREGVFRCPREGQFLLQDTLDGGEIEVDAADLNERLQKHRLFNSLEEGFWLVNPIAPPISKDELEQLMRAAMAFDEATLEEIIAQESAGWQREDLLTTARDALGRVQQLRAEAKAEAEAVAQADAKAQAAAAAETPPPAPEAQS